MISLTAMLFANLTGAINLLMEVARTPFYESGKQYPYAVDCKILALTRFLFIFAAGSQ